MYRSQIMLDMLDPSVQQALRNCNDMHRNLMRAFDVEDGGNPRQNNSLLYTLMSNGGKPALYVLSRQKPDWSRVKGYIPTEGGEPRDISSLHNVFAVGGTYHFRLFASPTKKIQREGKLSGRVFLKTAEEREKWLIRQAEKSGFSVRSFTEEKQTEINGRKGENHIDYTGVIFTGVLQITDAERFWNAYCSGIGPGKAYGLGMLMVRR